MILAGKCDEYLDELLKFYTKQHNQDKVIMKDYF